jgi:murein DD-endopeptidase MepM/ murein hydrolase activator NlpD
MNLIIVPRKGMRGGNSSLSHVHAFLIGVMGLGVLPVFFAVLTFQMLKLSQPGYLDTDIITRQQAQLESQRELLDATRERTDLHLNALAQRLGRLQAQMLRLNALGGRLTQMAHLDPKEFDFHAQPAMGGPADDLKGGQQDPAELLQSLNTLSTQIEQQSARLTALQSVLIDNQLQSAVTPAGWPVKGGWMSSGFGPRTDPFTGHRAIHRGVDIASPMGSPIYAMADGVVTWAGPRAGYGNMVEINHGQGLSTRYGHASAVTVKVGDVVSRGDEIAKVGSTGRSTGPHVHFEVLRAHHQVDPIGYLERDRVPTRFAHPRSLKTTTVAQTAPQTTGPAATPATTPEADATPIDTDAAMAHSGGPEDDTSKSTATETAANPS